MLDYSKFNAIVQIIGDNYKIKFQHTKTGQVEKTETFASYQECQEFLEKVSVNEVIEMSPTSENPPVEELPNNEDLSAGLDGPPLPEDPNDPDQLSQFSEDAKGRELYCEDGLPLTSHDPEALTAEEDQSEGDIPPDPSMPNYPQNSQVTTHDAADTEIGPDNVNFVDPKTTSRQKANIDLRGMRPEERKAVLQNASNLGGVLNSQLREANPRFKKLPGDQIWSGLNNQWMVFTRDRPGNVNTGYQAQGHTQAGAIDMVVGRMSPHPREFDKKGNPVKVGPIFVSEMYADEGLEVVDAARIYMSQKTDIDINFGLAAGNMGQKSTQSAIGLKADAVRVMSRGGGIKMVTHSPRLMNSQGAKNNTESAGVEIIAGNDDTNLQPMVLGDNLADLLTKMLEMISQINGTLSSITDDMIDMNSVLSNHVHYAGTGAPTTPSPETQIMCIKKLVKLTSVDKYSQFVHNWNNSSLENTYLGTSNKKSKKSILSKSNRVN